PVRLDFVAPMLVVERHHAQRPDSQVRSEDPFPPLTTVRPATRRCSYVGSACYTVVGHEPEAGADFSRLRYITGYFPGIVLALTCISGCQVLAFPLEIPTMSTSARAAVHVCKDHNYAYTCMRGKASVQ